ncbi:thiol-disulfide isomerase-like thioredoxin [Chthonomonas calidirosea]|uniref:Thiol-disulfide isomerase and thioredoxins n=1 Tax=Chthonomonas calidirosea (strain DSM 23976 / ICMP 18418 / T49) TaxID=1303518 RepID=S0EX53_CHTCT|nr:TlpA disulfide reductase family protein [Chthonomonas calidirosea]CCW34876.1 Thiol-disulfide isomerase and thioredoxins [Chthonomonas calidirosea T49]CEK12589.1 thiol-disulfide isomerase-like thioredoxin [Chthonomonas calidirosea]CEK13542.1 thiol-disulfide isomerase-like thioredoxin [Chthonomonas calidirosea]
MEPPLYLPYVVETETKMPSPLCHSRLRLSLVDAAILLCLLLLLLNLVTRRGTSLSAQPAPPLSITTPHGTLSLANYRNHVVLLDFFASWCLPCRISIPSTERLYRRYHRRGFEVIGISLDNQPSQLSAFLRNTGITYPAGLPVTGDILKTYQVQTIPLLILVDKQGRLRWRQEGLGLLTERQLEAQVQTLLKE